MHGLDPEAMGETFLPLTFVHIAHSPLEGSKARENVASPVARVSVSVSKYVRPPAISESLPTK